MNDIYHSDSTIGIAHLQYEYKLSKLKLDYYYLQETIAANKVGNAIAELQHAFNVAVEELRIFFNQTPELARTASSLYVVPTIELLPEQRLIHRIWLGSPVPFEVNEAIRQWFCAIEQVASLTPAPFRQILWVWQKEQIQSDPRFRGRPGEDIYQLGEIITTKGIMQVNSLQRLTDHYPGCNDYILNQLHQQRYYATLSDYFRLLILNKYGGIYMDADTLPYKPVSWFLFKPELPVIQHFPEGKKEAAYLSWLNLFLDETGMIIAAKDDIAIADIFFRLNQAYAGLPERVPPKNSMWERQIFELFYAIWCEHWMTTFISHDNFCQHYGVFYREHKEPVLCGVRGMRLQEDIISGERRPLSKAEQNSYRQAIRQLDAVDWTLKDALDLKQYCEIYSVNEVPRIAYSLQMRSDIEHFHYYSVLSEDPLLDRVNALFGHYLLKSNGENMATGNFWQTVGRHSDAAAVQAPVQSEEIIFVPGLESNDEDRNKMARLIFSTSYLEFCSVANPRRMDIISLQRAQNIDPWLGFITTIVTPGGDFTGFFTAGLMAQLKQNPVEYLYREEMFSLDLDYDRFVEKNSCSKDYFIVSLALEATARGKGYFRLLMAESERQAIAQGATRITLCVWENSRAYSLYLKYGFCQIDRSDRWLALFADRLCFLTKSLPLG